MMIAIPSLLVDSGVIPDTNLNDDALFPVTNL